MRFSYGATKPFPLPGEMIEATLWANKWNERRKARMERHMTDEALTSRLLDAISEITRLGGEEERTSIVPGILVVDATPNDLPSGYIKIQNPRDGTYVPCLTVSGLVVADNDLVNVLFAKGTEPIAISQASGSPSSGVKVSEVWESDFGAVAGSADASGNWTWQNNVTLASGDLSFSTASVIGVTGALQINATGGVVINESGADADTRIEGDTDPNVFIVDAGSNSVLIGTNTPSNNAKLRLSQSFTDHTSGLFGFDHNITVTLSSNATAQTYRALNSQIFLAGTGDNTGDVTGLVFSARNTGSGDLTTLQCLSVDARVTGSGAVANAFGYRVIPVLSTGGGNLSDWRAFEARSPSVSGGGALTTAHGVFIAAQKATGVTTGYGVRQVGTTDLNEFLGGVTLGSPTGGNKGPGTLNAANDIYKNDSAFNNPDYALELWATGQIEKYRDNEGAVGYSRLSLDEAETFIRQNYHLPGISRQSAGIFAMADMSLEKIEELFTYVIELHHRIKHLELKEKT